MSLTQMKIHEIMRTATNSNIRPTPPKGLSKEKLFYWKLKNDFIWYSENFLKIRNKNSQLVPFKVNEAQVKFLAIDKYCKDNNIPRRYIVLKARQMGFSTLTEGLLFHETSTTELTRSMILAHEEPASANLYRMSKLYYDELPLEIKPMKKYSNGKILSFENPSNDEKEIKANPGLRSHVTVATAGSGEVGRSSTITKLHASEVAFFPDAKTTLLGLLQAIPDTNDALVVLESTANGIGDYFHQQWQMGVNGESDFICLFFPWFTDSSYVRPFTSEGQRKNFIDEINITHRNSKGQTIHTYEYNLMQKFHLTYEQMHWRKWAIRNKCQGDEVLFMQEYPSTPEEAFISTGRPKFSITSLKKYQTVTKPPIKRGYLNEDETGRITFLEDDKGYISIWKEPQTNIHYSIGADVAEGLVDGDYSCGIVGNGETLDFVAMWHGHIDPDLFGVELIKLAKYYNNAYIGCEANNHGLTTLNTIKSREYWNVYFTKQHDKIADKVTQKIGWYTTSRTKPLMIDKLAEFVRERWLGIHSDLIISEMFTYIIEDNGSTNGQLGTHDDTVMAGAILLQLMLEGRGGEYIPEIPFDEEGKKVIEIIDELFEEDTDLEIAE